jgi:calcium binding protein 39
MENATPLLLGRMTYKKLCEMVQTNPSSENLRALRLEIREGDHWDIFVRGEVAEYLIDKFTIMECKNAICSIFEELFSFSKEIDFPTSIIKKIVKRYGEPSNTAFLGVVIRKANKNSSLNLQIYETEMITSIATLLMSNDFLVCTDAYITLKDVLTRHKKNTRAYFLNNMDCFDRYNQVLSTNYLAKRLVLQIYEGIFLDKFFFDILSKYVENPEYLRLIIKLMGERSERIRFDVFHVLKMFIANPNKGDEIIRIIVEENENIYNFLLSIKRESDSFMKEKEYLLKETMKLRIKE